MAGVYSAQSDGQENLGDGVQALFGCKKIHFVAGFEFYVWHRVKLLGVTSILRFQFNFVNRLVKDEPSFFCYYGDKLSP